MRPLLVIRSLRAIAKTLLAGALAIGWMTLAHAEVFRCVEMGKTLYQDTPCGARGQPIDTTNARVPEGAADSASAALDRLRKSATTQASEQRIIESSAEIERLDRQLSGYARAEEAELAALRSTLGYMNFNTVGAVWDRAATEASIRKKMQAVTDQYESKKQVVRERIALLRAQSAPSSPPATATPR